MSMLLGFVLVVSGCGGGDGVGRHDVSGKVTFNGEPLVYGEVIFRPATGPEGSASIRDGKYSTAAEGSHGVIGGSHTLFITGYAAVPPDGADETKATEGPPPLFIGYQMEADLSGATHDITVPADAAGHGQSKPGRKANVTAEP